MQTGSANRILHRGIKNLSRKRYTTQAQLNTYHIKMMDHKDSECLSRRTAVRQKHLEEIQLSIENKDLVFGGALLSPDSTREESTMLGSVLVIRAESEQAVVELLKKDQYAKNNVWDFDTLEINQIKVVPDFLK